MVCKKGTIGGILGAFLFFAKSDPCPMLLWYSNIEIFERAFNVLLFYGVEIEYRKLILEKKVVRFSDGLSVLLCSPPFMGG